MSKCSAAEIAEKRRIALEKLQSKNANNHNNNVLTTASKPSLLNKPINTYNNNLNNKQENSFKIALNALKQSTKFSSYAKDSVRAHPYKRPENFQTNFGNSKPSSTLNESGKQKLAPVFTQSTTCTVYMVSPKRFEIKASGYHAKLIEIFKTIPSRSYDDKTRNWNFALSDYELVLNRVGALKPDVVIGSIPRRVLDLCREPEKALEFSCLASIEPKLAEKLLPFQQEGVCFAIAQNGCIMICDEMGLGKTYQALAIADFYKEDWPLLIVTTATTRESWSSHIRELLPSVPVHYVDVLTSGDQYIGDAKILIVSYTILATHVHKLADRKFNFLIFDESHQLKNSKTKCSKAAELLARKAKYIVLLSGTPALSRPLELFTQIQLVDRKFMTFMEFTTRYCDGKQTNFGWDASGQSNLQELNVLLKLKFMIRRTKADVMPDMAKKSRETVILDPALVWPDDDVKETLTKFAKDLNASRGKEKEEILINFYAQTAAVKTKAVCCYLKTLIKEKIKFIVFAHHRIMLDAITECLNKLKVNFIRIDGQTRNEARAEYIKIFQTDLSCKVAVLSLRACNSGITLTAAEMIVFAELDWNPSTLAQAESRAHRIGQQKPVICRYLMATKTADDVIWKMLKNKQDVLNRAGLFCENLQAAKTTAAPTTSHKIEQYFSPDKIRSNNNTPGSSPVDSKTETRNSSALNTNSLTTTTTASPMVNKIDRYLSHDERSSSHNSIVTSPLSLKSATNENPRKSTTASNSSISNSMAAVPPSIKANGATEDLENIDSFFADDEAFEDITF